MVAPTVLPGRAFARVNRVSRALLRWRAADLALAPINEQASAFTRASAGGMIQDVAGVCRPIGHSQPRFEMADLDGDGVYETPTLLLEPARTNAWSDSEDLSNAVWTLSAVTLAGNVQQAPDGALSLEKVIESATNALHYVRRTTPVLTAATQQAVSVFARAGERTWLWIQTGDRGGVSRNTFVNLATGVVGTKDASHTVAVRRYAYGLYRIELAWPSGTGASSPVVNFLLTTGDGVTATYLGDGTSGLYLGAAQFETDAPWPSSYLRTPSPGTRSMDRLDFTVPVVPRECTLYARFVERGSIATGGARIAQIGSGTARLSILQSGGFYQALHHNGTSSVTSTLAAAPAIGDRIELRATLAADGKVQLHQSINEGAEVSAAQSAALALAAAWSDSLVSLGHAAGANAGLLAARDLTLAAGTVTLDQLRELL